MLTLGTTWGRYRRSKISFSIRCGIVLIASILTLALSLFPAKADELPKFSDAEVTQFVSKYADFVTNYIKAYQAGNPAAFDQLKTQVQQLQDEVAKVADKLKENPEEAQRYQQFIATYTEKMIDASK
ncbi:MAG: hypothetical protein JOZ31_20380 [Verrucomicrobia bacterium]|nr:hypothetical protein [Verrucomicrobiota bacterium]MBV8482005.1 hypothetical protein [Verrucomicrobiota bacterium]